MNDNNTNITYERVRANASTIRECANKMKNIFNDFSQTMNQVGSDDVFMGQASEAIKGRFNSLKGRFDSYTAKVEQFAAMISSAADQTQATEQSIARDADNLIG